MVARYGLPFALLAFTSACSLNWDLSSVDSGSADSSAAVDGAAHDAALNETATDAGPSCRSNADCAASSYCHFRDHMCGKGELGACEPSPTDCTDGGGTAVCSCAGNVADNQCEANKVRNDVSALGNCDPVAFAYSCGYVFCYDGPVVGEFLCERRKGTSGEEIYSCSDGFLLGCTDGCDTCNPTDCPTCTTLDAGGWVLDCN